MSRGADFKPATEMSPRLTTRGQNVLLQKIFRTFENYYYEFYNAAHLRRHVAGAAEPLSALFPFHLSFGLLTSQDNK